MSLQIHCFFNAVQLFAILVRAVRYGSYRYHCQLWYTNVYFAPECISKNFQIFCLLKTNWSTMWVIPQNLRRNIDCLTHNLTLSKYDISGNRNVQNSINCFFLFLNRINSFQLKTLASKLEKKCIFMHIL